MLTSRPNMDLAASNLATLLVNDKGDQESIARAIELAERFRSSKNAFYLDILGWVYYRAGEYEKAVSVMEHVIEKSPNTPLANYHLGMVYFKQGEKNKAKTFLSKAVESRTPFVGYKDAEATLEKL